MTSAHPSHESIGLLQMSPFGPFLAVQGSSQEQQKLEEKATEGEAMAVMHENCHKHWKDDTTIVGKMTPAHLAFKLSLC